VLEFPLDVNPEPDAEIPVMFRFALPVFVRVISCEVGVPTFTSPKLTLAVLAESIASGVWGVVLPLGEVAEGSLAVLLLVEVADWAFEEPLLDEAGD
jgi:hypothetical protein